MAMAEDPGLFSIAQMRRADAEAIGAGVSGIELMENAGRAVAAAIIARFDRRPVLVLCGPGNNGGDGFVAARLLHQAGWPVKVALLGSAEALQGDAAQAKARWEGPILSFDPAAIGQAELVIDAVFGAGLGRPVDGVAEAVLRAASERIVIAVDIPSGVHGDSGDILGFAPKAALTVTFHKAKPGHLLLPGRDRVGELIVADISIPLQVDQGLGINLWRNTPALWLDHWPRRTARSHKYTQGHGLVLGGGETMTGAARLAARAALRMGAGLVTVLCPKDALSIYAISLTAVMVRPFADDAAFEALLRDDRQNAILLGPGAGVGLGLRLKVKMSLKTKKAVVLDADALSSFADYPDDLLSRLHDRCLLTPHEGEFHRLFTVAGSKLERARAAARLSQATILLKGADTVVATLDGRAAIAANAPPWLATAGSGDTLAGMALGLMAQGMPCFEAACAAVWLHGDVANRLGMGLIAEDLCEAVPAALRALFEA